MQAIISFMQLIMRPIYAKDSRYEEEQKFQEISEVPKRALMIKIRTKVEENF